MFVFITLSLYALAYIAQNIYTSVEAAATYLDQDDLDYLHAELVSGIGMAITTKVVYGYGFYF